MVHEKPAPMPSFACKGRASPPHGLQTVPKVWSWEPCLGQHRTHLSEEHFICFGCSHRGEMSWVTDCLLFQRKGHRQKGISHQAWNWFHWAAARSSHAHRVYWSGSSGGNLTYLVRKTGKVEFLLLIFLIGWMSEAPCLCLGAFLFVWVCVNKCNYKSIKLKSTEVLYWYFYCCLNQKKCRSGSFFSTAQMSV